MLEQEQLLIELENIKKIINNIDLDNLGDYAKLYYLITKKQKVIFRLIELDSERTGN